MLQGLRRATPRSWRVVEVRVVPCRCLLCCCFFAAELCVVTLSPSACLDLTPRLPWRVTTHQHRRICRPHCASAWWFPSKERHCQSELCTMNPVMDATQEASPSRVGFLRNMAKKWSEAERTSRREATSKLCGKSSEGRPSAQRLQCRKHLHEKSNAFPFVARSAHLRRPRRQSVFFFTQRYVFSVHF